MRRSGGSLSLLGCLLGSVLILSGLEAKAFSAPLPEEFRVGIESTVPEFLSNLPGRSNPEFVVIIRSHIK